MKIVDRPLPGVCVLEPDVFRDGRGFFFESFNEHVYRQAGIPGPFVQDNHSRSVRGTLRGLHAQFRRPQAKLIRVLAGEIYDVTVDIRRGSPTYKKWYGVTLSSDNYRQCYVPVGYAHGFCVMSETAEIEYKVTDFYDPGGELRLLWNDPALGIEWPVEKPVLSVNDAAALTLQALEPILPEFTDHL